MRGRTIAVLSCLVLTSAIAGCGGDSGGGSESVNYNGASNAAVIDTTGAVSFARDTTLESISSDSVTDTSALPLAVQAPSLERFRDPGVVAGFLIGALGVKTAPSQIDLLAAMAEPLAYECVNIPSTAGSFSGTMSGRVCGDLVGQTFNWVDYVSGTFDNFSDDGISVIDGALILDATDSPTRMIFRDLNIDDSDTGEDLYLDGIVTVAEAGSVTTTNLNLFVRNFQLDEGVWYNNLTIVEEDFETYRTVTVDGRIYDFYDGYVEVDTTEAFEIDLGADYPKNGTIKFTTAGGLVVRLEVVDANGFMVYVDITGDGTDEWQTSSPVPWVEPT